MKISRYLQLGIMLGVVLASGTGWAASASQYNLSLQDKVVTGPKGSLTSPVAAFQYPVAAHWREMTRKLSLLHHTLKASSPVLIARGAAV